MNRQLAGTCGEPGVSFDDLKNNGELSERSYSFREKRAHCFGGNTVSIGLSCTETGKGWLVRRKIKPLF